MEPLEYLTVLFGFLVIFELLQVWLLRRSVMAIQAKVEALLPEGSRPGAILADGVISLMEKMGEESEEGDRARRAFGSMVLYGASIGARAIGIGHKEGAPGDQSVPGIGDLAGIKLPKKIKEKVALAQAGLDIAEKLGLLDKIKGKETKEPVTNSKGWRP